MSLAARTGTGADAELTTLIFEVAARRAPLQHLISRIHRNRTSAGGNSVASILSIPGIDGFIPLHRACQFGSTAMVKYLLKIGVHHRVAGRLSGAGGLFVQSQPDDGTTALTPMDLAIHRVRTEIDRTENDSTGAGEDGEDWEVLEICVRYADSARYRRPTEAILGSAPPAAGVIAAAVGIVPVDILAPMIARYRSRDSAVATGRFGRSVLTKAVHLATESQRDDGEEGNYDSWSIVFEQILDLEKQSEPKKETTTTGKHRSDGFPLPIKRDNHRHPLHVAAEYGLDWSNGVEPILQSDYDLLLVQDTTTRLYPFMLAASGTELGSNRRRVLQLLKRLLERRYKMCGGANPWIDWYACLHYGNEDSDVGGGTGKNSHRIKRKKDDFWRDIMYGSKGAEEKDRVTILNSDSLLFHDGEGDGTTTLSKDEAFSLVHCIAGLQTNLNTAFELLRQNPAIMNSFVTSVYETADNNIIDNPRDSKRNDSLILKEKRRRKQRQRRRRLRKNNKTRIMM